MDSKLIDSLSGWRHSATRAIRQWWHDLWSEPTEIGRRYEHVPTTAAPERMMFPATGWSVPAAGPNAQGERRAVQLYPKLVEYEWAVLIDAAGLESGHQIIAGAAYNECFEFLKSAGALNLMGKPTELGNELIAMRAAKRVDVV